jgi:23S rRNA pseudouridine2605 synthase
MMSKGQKHNARQPVARVKGRESSQTRNPQAGNSKPGGSGFIKSVNAPAPREGTPPARSRQPFNRDERAPFDRDAKKPFGRDERAPFNRDAKKPFNRDERAPFNRDEKKPFNRDERAPFNRDAKKPFNRDERAPFNRDEKKPFSRDERAPFNRDAKKPFNRDERAPFNRDEKKPFGRDERAPFNRDAKKPFGRDERAPFNRDAKKPFGRDERAPFNRDEKKPFNRDERAPFNRDEKKPFGRDERAPFNRDAKKPFNRDEKKPLGYGVKRREGRDERQPGTGGTTRDNRRTFERDVRQPFPHSEERAGSVPDRVPFNRDERQLAEREERRPAYVRSANAAYAATGAARGKFAPKVQRAKKMSLRDPNQKLMDKAKRLRETRVDWDVIEPTRLQKALSQSGVGSRREMEEWIEAGLILVNGQVATLGDRVGPRDRVMVKGHQIKLKWPDRLPRVILYHKQEGEMVTRDDPQGRVTIFDRLPQAKSSRWIAIGRLDVNTSGLLIVTTSGELANRLMHPSFEVEREYAVRVLGELSDEQRKELCREVELEDGPARFERIIDQGGEGANHWYRVVIKEGRNREVRRLFDHYDLQVSRLMRVRFGNIGLPPRLKRGHFYELNELEVAAVMKWSNLTVTGSVKK